MAAFARPGPWLLAVLLRMLAPPDLMAATVTVPASADARVEETYPTQNYGSASLRTRGDDGCAARTWLRFTVPALDGPVTSATLRLFATSSTVDGPEVVPVGGNWSEGSLTWGNQPAATGASVADVGAVPAAAWAEWNLTALVQGGGTYDVMLEQASTDGIGFAAREQANPPALVVVTGTCGACDDGNGCTADACTPTGCSHAAAKAPCEADGNPCTADTCTPGDASDPTAGATCSAGPSPCKDGDACTTDACDPASGACSFPPVAGCGSPLLIAPGSTWRYLGTGKDPGTAWRGLGYDDSAWPSGVAQLGYGDGDEATVVPPGGTALPITLHFRRTFTVDDPKAWAYATLRLLRDDGAVVYLNGIEILRNNMPAGALSASTLATSAVDDSAWHAATVLPARFVAGKNVLAVEIHQASASSSDASFDLDLTGTAADPAWAVPAASGALPGCTTACSGYGTPAVAFEVQDYKLAELSGLAYSRTQPGLAYGHNDGPATRIAVLDTATGITLGKLELAGVDTSDWEDIAVGPCPAGSCVYVGDVGGNYTIRSYYSIHRTAEPKVAAGSSFGSVQVAYDSRKFFYPDGKFDAEAMAVDPASGDVYVVTKCPYGKPSSVYVLPAGAGPGPTRLAKVTGLPLSTADKPMTAADIHPCGDRVLLRTYGKLYQMQAPAGAPLLAAFTAAVVEMPVALEVQGESVAWVADGRGYVTASEGAKQSVNAVGCGP